MSQDRWERTKEILEEALRLAPEQRSVYLDSACEGDHELRTEVESLLASYEEAGTHFLSAGAPDSLEFTDSESPTTSRRNLVIGPYRLVEEIGRGGMGQVWLAEQTSPVKRKVALKLIKTGLYDDEVLKRFQMERQSLAIMDHPAIAKVFDAATTPDGQPYFVMEYVPGIPITHYCDEKRLTIRERLELFIKVCEGVQHAHQKAVIHRDIKPANILVQEVDGKATPRIIDFGLAKAVSTGMTGESLHTRAGSFLGTPGYMSPEQADPSAQDVDTRTDVYSLGAVLYVLLTGFLPFEGEQTKKKPIHEALRQLREEDPPRPSAKASTTQRTSSTTAEARGTEPKQLVRVLRGDLDWITIKAIERDRTRRYATPWELAADTRRYLANETVEAHPASVWYRGRKFLRRYRVPVAAGVLVFASLTAGLYVANRERAVAQRRFDDVRGLANKLFDIDVQVRELPGSTKTRQLIVDTSLEYLRRLSADARQDPALALEVGNAYMRVARVQGVPISPTLGQMDQADKNLGIADGFIQSVLKAQPGNRTAMLRAAQIAHDQMILARFGHDSGNADELAKNAEGWLEKFHAGKGDESEATATLNTYLNVADQFASSYQYEDSLRVCQRGIEIADSFNRPSNKGDFLWVSARVYQQRGDLDKALAAIRESVQLLDPGPDWMTQLGRSLNFQHALVYEGRILGEDDSVSLGRPEEAVKSLERAFQIADAFVHRDPNDHASRGSLATAGISMGDILCSSDAPRALEIYDHTLRHLAEALNDGHLRRYEVELLAGSSYALRRLGRGAEARQRLDKALEDLKQLKLYPADKIDLDSEAAKTVRAIANYEADSGNLAGGIKMYEKLLSEIEPTETDPEFALVDVVRLSTICVSAATLYRRAGWVDQASALEARRLAVWRQWDRKVPNNPFVQRQLTAKRKIVR